MGARKRRSAAPKPPITDISQFLYFHKKEAEVILFSPQKKPCDFAYCLKIHLPRK